MFKHHIDKDLHQCYKLTTEKDLKYLIFFALSEKAVSQLRLTNEMVYLSVISTKDLSSYFVEMTIM